MNTQSGTQWDGFRHVAHVSSKTFYNGVKAEDFLTNDTLGNSVHWWRETGFTGRGVLLDYRTYAESKGLTYETAKRHSISYDELAACGKYQGLDIRPASQGGDMQIGDILLIRTGWTVDLYKRDPEESKKLALRKDGEGGTLEWVGVKQEQAIIDWLHDCYFAAVGGDQPSFEAWPTAESYLLHEYLLARWGMPIGEMLDLEKVAALAKKHKRYTFFLTSAPFRTEGGVSTYVNGTAIF